MPTSATAQRAPLAELPISLYASQASNLPPSPVSLPIKRGPLSASQKDSESSQMAKRRGSERISVTLEEDELGTGRSPARRLFAQRYASLNNCKTNGKVPLPSHHWRHHHLCHGGLHVSPLTH